MRPLNIVLPSGFELRITPLHMFFLCALLAAAGLLAIYVQLLNDSMARPPQWSVAPVAQTHLQKAPELHLPMHERFVSQGAGQKATQSAYRVRTRLPAQTPTQVSTQVSINSDGTLPSQTSR